MIFNSPPNPNFICPQIIKSDSQKKDLLQVKENINSQLLESKTKVHALWFILSSTHIILTCDPLK